jgi:hypothetical protein
VLDVGSAAIHGDAVAVNIPLHSFIECKRWCTPGMGVNLWGESPLYMNPVNVLNILTKILAEGKGIFARRCLKEARVQSCEPTNRNGIQGPVSG